MTYTHRELRQLGRPIAPEAAELRRWRREHCLTVAELAAILGVSPHYLQHVEVGLRRTPRDWQDRIAALYARWSDVAMPASALARARRKARRLRLFNHEVSSP